MNKQEPLKIEAGKIYRTRDGLKVRVYATDGRGEYIIHGALLDSHGWDALKWKIDGSFFCSESEYDLISEWIDAPEVDWSAMPKWATFAAMDECGKWHWFDIKPTACSTMWCEGKGSFGLIPLEYAPKFTGDWKNSLVMRPKA